jgi:putative FmdB family regulatory protein
MPVYEYECKDCGVKFEAMRSMKDADSPIKCESCNSAKTKRALSVCFSHSEGRESISQSSSSCGHCAGGSCANCH